MPKSNVSSRISRIRNSWIRKAATVLALAAIPACSGNGCSGCSGLTPLPGGFTPDKRIENSASVRITSSGFQFLSQNIGAIAGNLIGGGTGGLEFPINQIDGSYDVPPFGFPTIHYTVCNGGPMDNPKKCIVEIDLANSDLNVTAGAPHEIYVNGSIRIRLSDLPVDTDLGGVDITLSGNQACPGDNATYANIGISLDLSVETDTDPSHGARVGDSRLKINALNITKQDISNSLNFCNGGILGGGLNLFKSNIVDLAYDSINNQIKSAVEGQFCQKSNPAVSPSCPTGSNDIDGTCRYGTDANATCVSQLLGTDGHVNLGGLLASLSPGTKGGMDFMLAAGGASQRDDGSGYTWGDLDTVGGGATLGIYGGVEPNPLSGCIPISDLALPQGIPIPAEMIDDSLITDWPQGTPGPHIGLAISERYFNYALNGMYNSGLLCIGITTESVDLLNSGTLALLAGSLRDLGLQHEPQPIGIVIRPSSPPVAKFGNGTNIDTDPNVAIDLNQAAFDFYILSSDRFIRFMTATFDIHVPVNLTVTPDGLVPVLSNLSVQNGVVTNSELLKEDPTVIAGALQSLLSSQIGSLLGNGLPAVDINSPLASFGLKLDIPPTVDGQGSPGLRKLTKGSDNYLGIFASLEPSMFQADAIDTQASVVSKDVDQRGLRAPTITKDNGPDVLVLASSPADDGIHPVEYQVRVDGGLWKPWTDRRYIHVRDESLRIEGKHFVEVRSRLKGQAYTLDPSPAGMQVIIDTVAPEVNLKAVSYDGMAKIDVFDLVSRDATMVRYKLDDGAFSEWIPTADLKQIDVGANAEEITIEARDEEGNVGTSKQALLRGLDRSMGSGCGCSVPGTSSAPTPWALAVLGASIAGIVARLRRRSQRAKSSRAAKAASDASDAKAPAASSSKTAALSAGIGAEILKSRKREIIAAAVVLAVGGSFAGCNCGDTIDDGSYKCDPPACATLQPGLIGSYTSTAVTGDTLWVAGYLEADYDNSNQYGDLVVGKWNGKNVDWQIIDGVPTDPVDQKAYNVKGFRGGQTASGDDVGLWTSIALDSSGAPAIAYFDRTHKALKYAELNGKSWEISTVQGEPNADLGRYAKLHFEGDSPVIAYLAIEPSPSGFVKSGVRVARGDGTGGWSFEDVVVDDQTPCRAELCTGGSICEAAGQCVAAGSTCGMCGTGQQCVNEGAGDVCADVLAAGKLDTYPLATGLYIATSTLPDGGFGIAYYDRVAGTENIAYQDGSAWTTAVVDGGDPNNPSDVGVGTSLHIDDSGDWHLAYVDGYSEAVKYARVSNGAVQIETIDDGLQVGGVPFPDGQHIVGDDSFITVAGDGTVHVSYQDATNGKLRFAEGAPSASGHDWTVKVVDQDGFAGFFSHQVQINGALQLVNWWRKGGEQTMGDVAVVSP